MDKHASFDKCVSLMPLPMRRCKRICILENSPNFYHKDTLDEFTIS